MQLEYKFVFNKEQIMLIFIVQRDTCVGLT